MIALLAAVIVAAAPAVREGDIVFQTSKSSQSLAIQLATHSKYSHVGVVVEKDGKLVVLEAVQPVKYTPVEKWIARGEGAHVVVKRLADDAKWTEEVRKKLRDSGAKLVGKDYDLAFGWSDERIYCSELVWKLYRDALGVELSLLKQLKDFDLSAKPVKAKLRERYGDKLPLEEKVVAPQDLFESKLLLTVGT